MQNEEILGRCEVCGSISQESNVRRHMREFHKSPVQPVDMESHKMLDEMHDYEDQIEDFSQNDEFDYNTESQNDENQLEIEEENMEMVQVQEKIQWKTPEVQLLIQLYEKNKLKFEDKKTKNKKIWQSIAGEIRSISNFEVTPEQCENKFRNLKKTYKSIIDNNNKSGRGVKNWPFFKDMDQIFAKDPDVNPISTCSNLEGPSTSDHVDKDTHENISTSNQNVQNVPHGVKRKKRSGEEPEWFKKFREDCQKRHEEKM
ncbi:unnamed protein product, partial [Phaedon cochleariae]